MSPLKIVRLLVLAVAVIGARDPWAGYGDNE